MQAEKQEANIVIDELDLNSEQSKYRRELSQLVAAKMEKMLFEVVRKECDGCVHEQPNQLAHDLCLASLNEKIERCFSHMMNDIDLVKLKAKCNKEQFLQDEEWLSLTKTNLFNKYDEK